jgi:Uncharacterised protein conserved in bacteria (DUF2336)
MSNRSTQPPEDQSIPPPHLTQAENAVALNPLVRPDFAASAFFPGYGPRWTDALIARTRRHIGGCASGLETALRLQLSRTLPADLIDQLPPSVTWRAIERAPCLLDEELFAHFRTRAALSLMSLPRISGHDNPRPLFDTADPPIRDFALGLDLAVARWNEAGHEESPMRVDLPAEHVQSLVWLVSAALVNALIPTQAVSQAENMAAVDHAALDYLALYDEQAAPVGQASLLARKLRGEADIDLVRMAQEGKFLLLAAIMADRCGLETSAVASAMIHAHPSHVLPLIGRAANVDAQAMALTALALRQARDSMSDDAIGMMVERYEQISPEQAHSALAGLSVSNGLQAALKRFDGAHAK